MTRYALLFALAVFACNDASAPPNADGGGSGSTGGGSSADGTTVASSADSTTTGSEPELVLELDLELETLEDVHVELTRIGDEHSATVVLSRGYGVAPDGDAVSGPARIDALPEAGATIYGARLAGPDVPGGPCGDEPVSLALALHHDDDGNFIAGGLTPYCGADVFYGVPPIEPLRISGRMPD
jgi:hypothetical protein